MKRSLEDRSGNLLGPLKCEDVEGLLMSDVLDTWELFGGELRDDFA